MTDPQTRIGQLEQEVRRWRRVALIMTGAFVLLVLGFGALVTHAYFETERLRAAAEQSRAVAEQNFAQAEQARKQAEVQRAFLEKELLSKTK